MRTYQVTARVPEQDPAVVFAVLADFAHYVGLTEAVRSIDVTPIDDDHSVSAWEVKFRGGILRWKELDQFDRRNYTIHYVQTEGDMDLFEGLWRVIPGSEHCVVEFLATFDLGIPGLEDVLDPIAVEALHENILAIVRGLFGLATEFLAWHNAEAQRSELVGVGVDVAR